MNEQATSQLSVRLDLPPTANNQYFTNAHGGRTTTAETSAWRGAAQWAVKLALGGLPPPAPPYRVVMLVYFQDRRRDVDNCVKPVLDAVIPMLGGNDNYVDELWVYRRIDKLNPRLDVVVTHISDEEGEDECSI